MRDLLRSFDCGMGRSVGWLRAIMLLGRRPIASPFLPIPNLAAGYLLPSVVGALAATDVVRGKREPISQAQCVAATSCAASSHPPSRRRDLWEQAIGRSRHKFSSSEVVRAAARMLSSMSMSLPQQGLRARPHLLR
jgi:hypothetical protein